METQQIKKDKTVYQRFDYLDVPIKEPRDNTSKAALKLPHGARYNESKILNIPVDSSITEIKNRSKEFDRLRNFNNLSEEQQKAFINLQKEILPSNYTQQDVEILYDNYRYINFFGEESFKQDSKNFNRRQRNEILLKAFIDDELNSVKEESSLINVAEDLSLEGKLHYLKNLNALDTNEGRANLSFLEDSEKDMTTREEVKELQQAYKEYKTLGTIKEQKPLLPSSDIENLSDVDTIKTLISVQKGTEKTKEGLIETDYKINLEAQKPAIEQVKIQLNQLSEDEINKMFDQIATNYIPHYKAFEGDEELENFNLQNKIQWLSEINVLSSSIPNFENKISSIYDKAMTEYIDNQQDWWDRTCYTAQNIGTGIVSYVVNTGLGLYGMGVSAFGDDDDYADFLNSSTVKYWDNVSKYGTFNESELAKAERWGISAHQSVNPTILETVAQSTKDLVGIGLTAALTKMPLSAIAGKAGQVLNLSSKAMTRLNQATNLMSQGIATAGMSQTMANSVNTETLTMLNTIINKKIKDDLTNLSQDPEIKAEVITNYINSPEIQQQLNDLLKEHEKQFDKLNNKSQPFGEGRQKSPKLNKKQYLDQVKNQFLSEITDYAQRNIESLVYSEYKDKLETQYQPDREKAKLAAADAAATQATLTGVKDFGFNAVLGQWKFARNGRVNFTKKPSRISYDNNGIASVSKLNMKDVVGSGIKKFSSEFVDEWTDYHLENFSAGFGLGRFNDLTAGYYDPKGYLQSHNNSYNFLTPVQTGLKSVADGFLDVDGLYEGFIGGLSGAFNFAPNVATMVGGTKSYAESFGKESFSDLTKLQKFNFFFNNGVISELTDIQSNIEEEEEKVKNINEYLKNNGEVLQDIHLMLHNHERETEESYKDNITASKDARVRQGFELAHFLLKDDFSNNPLVKKQIEELHRLAKGDVTQEDITQYINQHSNRDLRKDPNAENIAKENLQKNAKELLDIVEQTEQAYQKLNNSTYGKILSDDAKKQLVFNKVYDFESNDRLNDLETQIQGSKQTFNTHSDISADFNSKEGYEAMVQTLKENIQSLESEKNKLEQNIQKNEYIDETALNKDVLMLQSVKEALLQEQEDLNELENSGYDESDSRVLTKEEIMRLNPKQRAQMLDSKNAFRYNKKQRDIIKNLINELKLSNPNTLKLIQESAEVYNNKQSNLEAYNKILENHLVFTDYAKKRKETFEIRAHNAGINLVVNDIHANIKNLKDEELKDALTSMKYSSNILGIYREKYIEKGSSREEVLQNVENLIKLYEVAIRTAYEQATSKNDIKYIASSIYDVVQKANNSVEAMSLLETKLNRTKNKQHKELLEKVLDELVLNKFQRDTKKIKSKTKDSTDTKKTEKQNTRRGHKQIEKAKRDLQEAKTPLEKANAISIFDTNVYHGAEATQEEKDLFDKAKEELKAEGYEIVEMLGKAYHEGMKVTSNFVEDDNLKPGETVITRVTKPMVTKDGVMVQSAEITVNQGPPIEESSNDNKKSSIEQAGEPEDVLDEDLNPDYNSPTIEEQAKQTGEVAQTINKDAIDNNNDLDEDNPDQYAGNIYPGYEVEELNNRGKLIKKTGAVPTDVMSTLYNFLEEKHIKLQEIIDYEFGKILEKNPDVKVHFVMHRTNNTAFNGYIFNVIEYTADVEKIHKDTRGGVITINGKQYLMVGITGTNFNKGQAHEDKYISLVSRLKDKKIPYFNNPKNSNEEYWLSSEYSQVKKVQAGQKVRMLENEDSPEIRSLKDLLYDEDGNFNEERNPNHIGNPKDPDSAYEELSWYIQKGKNYLPINVGNQNALELTNPSDNNGAVFLLIKCINGDLIPTKIEPIVLSQLKEDSVLKNRIIELLIKVADRDLNVRKQAKDQLRQFLVLSDEDLNITLKGKSENEISIMRNGSAIKTFKLDENFNTVDFISAVTDVEFRINITASVLNNPALLAEYDEAGAIKTDLACLAFRNASYTLYDIDSEGLPIITDTPTNKTVTKNTDSNETIRQIQYGNKRYRKEGNVYIDETDTPLLPNSAENIELIRKLEYSQIIQNMTPDYQKEGYNYYVIDNSDTNPLVVKVGRSNDITIGNVNQSKQILNEIKQEAERKAQAEAAKKRLEEESEDVDLDLTEDAPPPLNETQEDLDDAAFIEQETYGQTTIQTNNTKVVRNIENVKVSVSRNYNGLTIMHDEGVDTGDFRNVFTSLRMFIRDTTVTKNNHRLVVFKEDGNTYFTHEIGGVRGDESLTIAINQSLTDAEIDSVIEAINEEHLRAPDTVTSIKNHLNNLYNQSSLITSSRTTNTTSNKPVENLADSNNLTTFADVITKTIYKGQLFKIFKEKGWTWSNKQSDLEAFLKSKDVPLIGITDIDNWLDIIKNCR